MAVTIHDVAHTAGVSVATVSRYVNASGKLAAPTALKVRKAIAQLGYSPNAIGRNLSTSKTKTIAVVIPSLSNPVFAEAVEGINQVARQEGYTLMFTATDYNETDEGAVIQTLLAYRPDGIILTVAAPNDCPSLDILTQNHVPHVLVYNQPCKKEIPTITVDNIQAGVDVAKTFLDLGHEKTVMIAGSLKTSDRAAARWDGFSNHINKSIGQKPQLVEVDFIHPDIEGVVQDLYFTKNAGPTAIFCSNDLLALSIINCLSKNEILVPEHVSVIGFDGIAVSAQFNPVLTSVVQPSKDMGRKATETLLALINGEKVDTHSILPHSLRHGETTGIATTLPLSFSKNPFHPRKGNLT